MTAEPIKVECIFCRKGYDSKGIARHFLSCREKKLRDEAEAKAAKPARGDQRVFLIKISDGPQYWLIIEANAGTTLIDLDKFLRKIWLECCGHLSMFKINGIDYEPTLDKEADYWGEPPESANIALGKVLGKGLSFDYEYDFGSTTYLKLKVIDERVGQLPKNSVRLLARNPEPDDRCAGCNQKATLICRYCGETACDTCASDHDCEEGGEGDEAFSDLVNSPRMGVCGYNGPAEWKND